MALHLMMISLYEENRCLENDDISFQFLTKAKEIDWTPQDPEQADIGEDPLIALSAYGAA